MLVECEKCGAKYNVTIKKSPGKSVRFKCGKCSHMIEIAPEGNKSEPVKLPTQIPAPKPKTTTLQCTCMKCGGNFLKQGRDKSRLCYQCRIDAIVAKTREKAAAHAEAKIDEHAAHKYIIRNADGLVLGPIKLRTVAVLVREKRVHGNEEVQKDEGDFKPLAEYPELLQFFPHLKAAHEKKAAEAEETAEQVSAESSGNIEEQRAEALHEESGESDEEIDIPFEIEDEGEVITAAPDEKPVEAAAETGASREERDSKDVAEESAAELAESEEEDEEEGAAMIGLDESIGPRVEIQRVQETSEPEAGPVKMEDAAAEQAGEEDEEFWKELQERTKKKEEIVAREGIEAIVDRMETSGEEPETEEIEELEELLEEAEQEAEEDTARYRVRYSDGMVLGPVKISTVRDLFSAGNLTGQEEIQREDEEWISITRCPGLKDLFDSGDEIGEDEVIELTELLEEA